MMTSRKTFNFRQKLFSLLILSGLFLSSQTVLAGELEEKLIPEIAVQDGEEQNLDESKDIDVGKTVKITTYRKTFTGDIEKFSMGSGTIIREDGIILTNNHMVTDYKGRTLDAFEICLTTSVTEKPACGRIADLVASNKDWDIALLKIEAEESERFPFFDYTGLTELAMSDSVTVIGYPSVGEGMITVTQGTISGFGNQGAMKYIKTDAGLSEGNSGGTALDKNGNFIGVPTGGFFSMFGQLGYIIDVNSVQSWISENIDSEPQENKANELLTVINEAYSTALETGVYERTEYPRFNVKLEEKWILEDIRKNVVIFRYNGDTEMAWPLMVNVEIKEYPFVVTNEVLEKEIKPFESTAYFGVYKKIDTLFAGVPAKLISFGYYDQKNYSYFIPYGYALITVNYGVNLSSVSENNDEENVKALLNGFTFLDKKKSGKSGAETTYQHDYPPFQITETGQWHFQKNLNSMLGNTLGTFVCYGGSSSINVDYNELPPVEKELTTEELIENRLRNFEIDSYSILIDQDKEVVLDGLPGWYTTIFYNDFTDYSKTRISTEFNLRSGDYLFTIKYNSSLKDFEENLNDFRGILESFQYLGNQENKGKYQIKSFEYPFTDLTNYPYFRDILSLKGKGVIKGYPDRTFRPLVKINRAESLKIILESAATLYPDKKIKEDIEVYNNSDFRDLDFKDWYSENDWFVKYLRYGRKNELISGYQNGTFHPEQEVTLAEALSLLFKVYQVEIFEGDKSDWTKPILMKARELNILPLELNDPNYHINRGEFSFLVNGLTQRMWQETRFGMGCCGW